MRTTSSEDRVVAHLSLNARCFVLPRLLLASGSWHSSLRSLARCAFLSRKTPDRAVSRDASSEGLHVPPVGARMGEGA
jgi:hypothetical protein